MTMSNINKERIRTILSFLLSFLAALFLSFVCLIAVARLSFCRESVILDAARRCNYTAEMKTYLAGKFAALSVPSGVPDELYTAFLEEKLTEDISLFPLKQIFSESEEQLDLSAEREDFIARVTAYGEAMRESGDIVCSDEEWEERKVSFGELADYYIKEMHFAVNLNGVFLSAHALLQTIQSLSTYVFAGFGILFAVLVFVLCRLNSGKKVFPYLYAVFGTSGILFLCGGLFLSAQNYVMRLGLEPRYFKLFLHETASSVLYQMKLCGAILLGIALLFAVASIILLRKKKEKSQNDTEI